MTDRHEKCKLKKIREMPIHDSLIHLTKQYPDMWLKCFWDGIIRIVCMRMILERRKERNKVKYSPDKSI